MSALTDTLVFALLGAVAVIGAVAVVVVKDVMRMALGLGAFLLAVAGLFALYGLGFLALAEVFLYVGGVLVLLLFAIMLVHHQSGGTPELGTRGDFLVVLECFAVGALLFVMLMPVGGFLGKPAAAGPPVDLAGLLLGRMLPHFEAIGVLLLVALAAVVVIMGGDRE